MSLANVRELPRTLALCVCVLALPTLAIGFQADDFVIAQQVRSQPLAAFEFFPGGEATNKLREQGVLNWSASHDLKLRLLRPLSSLSHALDFVLWPDAPWIMHLENVLLYAAVVWLAALIYAELLGGQLSARLAALFYAFSPGHATAIGWISSRNTLLCALLGLLTLLLFVRAKVGLAVSAHALALTAGEGAVAVLAPLLAYALILDGRPRRLLPHLLLCGGYSIVYTTLGYGAAHGGCYLNALQQPWAVAENLVKAVPLYLCSSLVVPYAGMVGLLPSGQWWLVLLSCAALAALAPCFLPVLRSSKHAQFFAVSALGSILPLSATTPQDRLSFFVGFGCCGLLAVCLSTESRAPIPRALLHLHTSGSLLAFVPLCFVICAPALGGAPRMIDAALSDVVDRDVVMLNAPIETAIVSVDAMRRERNASLPRSLRALYVGGASYNVRRVDTRTLDLEVEGAWFRNVLERLVRDPRAEPFHSGDEEHTDIFSARVLEVDPRGAPLRVRFQFNAPLDDPRWLWLRLEGTQVRFWTPPPIAKTQHLAAAALF